MRVCLEVPDWLATLEADGGRLAGDEDAMRLALHACARNIEDGGGPFGALVMDEAGELIALGVNRVVPGRASFLHAEMMALLRAQHKLGSHDLSAAGACTLVSTCAPCAMCLGALPFSGIAALVCGARGEDAEAVGFDEGAKPPAWVDTLAQRGIAVRSDCLRDEARALLLGYRDAGGQIY
jgi:tRNA(Arg) A34 adenosine deaminase TadA